MLLFIIWQTKGTVVYMVHQGVVMLFAKIWDNETMKADFLWNHDRNNWAYVLEYVLKMHLPWLENALF